MLKNTLITIFFISQIFNLEAQPNLKHWKEGPLDWSDFYEVNDKVGVCELEYNIGFTKGKQISNNTKVKRYEAECYINKSLCWVNKDFKTEQYLIYNQVIFNIAELHRRKLQSELDKITWLGEAKDVLERATVDCNIEVNSFKVESKKGQDINTIMVWALQTENKLYQIVDNGIPAFRKMNFGVGFHGGYSIGYFTGSLGNYFSQANNLIFGMDIDYKNSILFIAPTLGRNRVTQNYQMWEKGLETSYVIIDVSYGYAVINNRKLRLTPFIGLGITELSERNKSSNEGGLVIEDNNFIFGLNADHKIRRKLVLTDSKELNETSIRTRLYVTKANFSDDLNGYIVNLSIEICGIFRGMKIIN